jgi:DNA-binding MarR family transcriptional regulator
VVAAQRSVEITLEVVPRLARLVTRVLEAGGTSAMTVRQFRVLDRLAAGEDAVGRLAAGAGVRAPSMSEAIDGLVARGWVSRAEDPTDRRRRRLGMTPSGERARADARRALDEAFAELLAELPPADEEAFTRGLEALGGVLDRKWAAMLERMSA